MTPLDVLRPGDDGYERARLVWNGMVDRRPAMIVRCAGAGDVVAALRLADAEGLPVTVRGGGHNVAGTAVADGALMIDLSRMRGVRLEGELAHAGGGALLGDVDAATVPAGLAVPVGVVSLTGLAGLALGGGYGWLARRYGLTCDHLVSAEIVLADGTVTEVDDDSAPELMWGLRGGGGNFGVVTRFTLRTRPVPAIWLCSLVYPLAQAPDVIAAYRDLAPAQPDEFQMTVTLRNASSARWIPHHLRGKPVVIATVVWLGRPTEGVRAGAPLFAAVRPAARQDAVRTYTELQTMSDEGEPPGRRYYTKSGYLTGITGGVVDALVASAGANRSPYSYIDVSYLLGAIARVPDDATAFPRRQAPHLYSAAAAWPDEAGDGEAVGWARGVHERLADWQYGGSYVNYTHLDATSAVAVYGPERYARLARLKAEVDPDNRFRGNHNVVPSTTGVTGDP